MLKYLDSRYIDINITLNVIIFGFIFIQRQMAKNAYGIFEDFPERCQQPKYNGKNLTNRVLCEQYDKKRIIYYCPAYLRLQIKNFAEMSHEDLEAAVNSVLILTLNFRGISPVLEEKLRPMLKLSFNRDDSIQIKQNSRAMTMTTVKNGIYTYTIQKLIHVAMMPDIFLSPFQIINLVMSISIKDIQINSSIINEIIEQAQLQLVKAEQILKFPDTDQTQRKINNAKIVQLKKEIQYLSRIQNLLVRFNFMNTDIQDMKINYTAEGTFGVYDLAENLLTSEYSNNSTLKKIRDKHKKQMQQRQGSNEKAKKQTDFSIIKPFNYAHFEIPLYKAPAVTLTTIFFPLWLLSILVLGIYFQDVGLADRIGSMSGLMIAFVALIPVIRGQLPLSPKITLVEILVYFQIFTCILCFIESVNVRNYKDLDFVWQNSGLFLVSAGIEILQIIIIGILMIVHKCCWQPNYNKEQSKTELRFNHEKWQNIECDRHFRRKIDSYSIKICTIDQKAEKIKQNIDMLDEEEKEHLRQVLQSKKQNQFAKTQVPQLLDLFGKK